MESNNVMVLLRVPAIPHNETDEKAEQYIKDHIKSFPRIDSHYCRADSKQEYIEGSFTIRQIHVMYKDKCVEEEVRPLSEGIYRKIFNEKFNIAFHVPNKDLCDSCEMFKAKQSALGVMSEEAVMKQEYHLSRKEQARVSKALDKVRPEVVTAVFDLQQVMICPKLSVGSSYYLRKLSVYNLTVLQLNDMQGYCYTWNESEGKRGANEIATAVVPWLKLKDVEEQKHIIFYSDTCGGQNRNKIMCTAIFFF